MKRTIILCALLILGCSSSTSERSDWDSGADATKAYQQEQMQENAESTRNQNMTIRPSTDVGQPF